MWDEILNLAIKNGLWAVLFLGLFIFVIRDSTTREKKYQDTIKNLTEHLGVVKDIKEDVDAIKKYVYSTKRKVKKENKKDIIADTSSKNILQNTSSFLSKDKE